MHFDEEEYAEILESLVALMDDARSEAYEAIKRGGATKVVALQYCHRLQSAVEHAQQRFPSEWRVEP
jgi:hypothetical protein